MVLNGGADVSKFDIDKSSGALSFKSAPDYENPTDNGGNNSYEVRVQAKDNAGNISNQTLTVNVTDINEDIALDTNNVHTTFNGNLYPANWSLNINQKMLIEAMARFLKE